MVESAQIKLLMGKHWNGRWSGRPTVTIASGGMLHDIDLEMVESFGKDQITLAKTAGEAVQSWH
jgi:hypothetical protein